jgi:DNA-binding NarL/FixJ family response regulator
MAMVNDLGGYTRVAVVDDDADTRLFLKDIILSEKNYIFTGAFSTAKEALTAIPKLRPDLAVIDISLPDLNGVECTKRLKEIVPALKVVIVSGNRERNWFDRSLEAGAVTYLIKPVDPSQLIATLRFVIGSANGPARIQPGQSKKYSMPILNDREREVLNKLAEGLLYKEIADVLGISYAAVHKCQHTVFRKLHVANRAEAMRVWLQMIDH